MAETINPAGRSSPDLDLQPALREHTPVLANLLELYAHDFSEFYPLHLGEDGRFGYPSLSLYWSEPDRHPFFLRVNGKLAGLAFVKRDLEVNAHPVAWDLAEFFVLRGFRRQGIGTQAVHQLWRRFPGSWQVRVMQSNISAYQFWQRTIASFTGKDIASVPFQHGGHPWQIFSFHSTSASDPEGLPPGQDGGLA